MTSKRSIGWFLESSWAWTFFSPERSLNQPKATRVCIRSINQSNRSISVRLLFLFCSRVFIPRSYENRSHIIIYMMLTPKSSDKIQSLIFLRSTNKGLTYHNSHEDQSLILMHRFTNAGSRPWEKGGGRGEGGRRSKKNFFSALWASVWSNHKEEGVPPGPLPLIRHCLPPCEQSLP